MTPNYYDYSMTMTITIRECVLTPLPVTAVTPPPTPPVTGVMGGETSLFPF